MRAGRRGSYGRVLPARIRDKVLRVPAVPGEYKRKIREQFFRNNVHAGTVMPGWIGYGNPIKYFLENSTS